MSGIGTHAFPGCRPTQIDLFITSNLEQNLKKKIFEVKSVSSGQSTIPRFNFFSCKMTLNLLGATKIVLIIFCAFVVNPLSRSTASSLVRNLYRNAIDVLSFLSYRNKNNCWLFEKMSDLVERISFIVPLISISFVLIITSINLYIKIRQHFPIKVNCWFCNSNAKVPYNEFNSWTCRSCDQYNGFDKDGDYNCDIPAQRSMKLNKRWKTSASDEHSSYGATTTRAARNGLCPTCNRNQEIKMQQLASFEPQENFDDEIEHFRERLEKSYELCYSCQRVVKKTLSRVMNNVLGLKLSQIGARGLQTIDRHVKSFEPEKRLTFYRISLVILIVLSMWNLNKIGSTVNLSKKHLDAHFPPLVTSFTLIAISYISAIKLLLTEYFSMIPFFNDNLVTLSWNYIANDIFKLTIAVDYFIETDFVVNIVAALLSLVLVLQNGFRKLGSISIMLLWNVNMLWPTIVEVMETDFPGELLKICNAALLLVTTILTILTSLIAIQPKREKGQGNNSFHRIYSNCDEELSENSDNETPAFSDTFSSTPRSKKNGSLSYFKDSCSSLKSITPPGKVPWASDCNSLNYSIRSHRDHCNDSFSNRNDLNEMYFFPNKMNDSNRCPSMVGLNSAFRIPDECHSKLTDLKISGMNNRNNKTITCLSPTPSVISLNRQRSQLLTPSRLNSHSPLNTSVTQSSWVAGGFFNNLSPQKRQQNVPLHPVLSRTSSQSSGFESHSSSAHNGHANGSRESSIAGDAVSIFSEPTLIADSASQMGINDSTLFASTLSRPQAFSPSSNKVESFTSCLSFPRTSHSESNNFTSLPFSPQPRYHQFGTHRHSNYTNDSLFNKCSSPHSTIHKGSLIKPFSENYLNN
ncbi:Transmembrane protein [Pseudolycoriella hygida]|uniref:Transmembrane protein n=1 Tax=Pseudolycoriella hygida TaxID=35572 RepID=A0A9Q0RYK6_9DIPT|nr:Transmembrane protein [Pseudolycoriella hygida]